jgi:nicotinamidase-related amidase
MKKPILSFLLATTSFASTTPPTLLDIAGARWPAAQLANSVLVIVDAQRDYTEGGLVLPDVQPAVVNIASLLARARAAGTPVIHVVQQNKAGSPLFAKDSPLAEIVPALTPQPGETIVVKHLPNSFASTSLETLLQKIGRKDIIVVGFMTHMCVSATVRSALDHDYRCTVVANCCATRDLPDGSGGVVSAADIHRMELAALRDRFATVVTSSDDIRN